MTADSISSVSLQDVSVQRGKRRVLGHISCEIAAASCTAIIGPNGAGKTTLLKAILGLLPLSSGSVSLSGTDIQGMNYNQRAQAMSYVPQQSALQFPLIVRDVILQGQYSSFGHRSFSRLSTEARDFVNGIIERLDLIQLVDRPFNQLSGGECQRVLLARALASRAQMLILDEPTAHLDIAHVIEMKKQIDQLRAAGQTVIVVVHSIQDAADMADRLILLNNGEIADQGSVEDLVARGSLEAVYGVRIEKTMQYGFAANEP